MSTAVRKRATERGPGLLRFPEQSLVLVAGIPGAGKSTLLRKLAGRTPESAAILDAEDLRLRWERLLGRLPYKWWRPLLHTAHYIGVLGQIMSGGPIVLADCGTRPWSRWMIKWAARTRGLQIQLIVLDVTAEEALAGQRARGRTLGRATFEMHRRRIRELLDDPHSAVAADSVLVLDRTAADGLRGIAFDAP